jgi:hypothetical protein
MVTNPISESRDRGRRVSSRLALLISILSICSALAHAKGDAVSSSFRIIGRGTRKPIEWSRDFSAYSGKSNFQEIVQAAKDGFRIMPVPVSSPFVSFVMERYGDANGPYSYKLFEAALSPKTAKELNKSTKGGFRLMPSTFAFQPHQSRGLFAMSDMIFAILEKPPVPIQCEYIAKEAVFAEGSLLEWAGEKTKEGFAIVVFDQVSEPWVLMERCWEDKTPAQTRAIAQHKEYRLVKGKQDEIDKLAALGYKMVESLCDDRFLFAKTEGQPDIYSYKLLSLKSLGALNEMRKEGYSISPRSVCGSALLMEEPASRSGSFDYEVDEPLDAPQLYRILDEAKNHSFRLVAILGKEVILERNSATQ